MFCTYRKTVWFAFWLDMVVWASVSAFRCLMGMIVYIIDGKPNVLDLKWNHMVGMFYSQNNIYICVMSVFSTVSSFSYLFRRKYLTTICNQIQIRTQLLAKYMLSALFHFFYTFKFYSTHKHNMTTNLTIWTRDWSSNQRV